MEVFIRNRYKNNCLGIENRKEHTKEKIHMAKLLYVPYHPRAIDNKIIKDDLGFSVVCKKERPLPFDLNHACPFHWSHVSPSCISRPRHECFTIISSARMHHFKVFTCSSFVRSTFNSASNVNPRNFKSAKEKCLSFSTRKMTGVPAFLHVQSLIPIVYQNSL